MSTRHALIVRGGWEGHDPLGCTELFLPRLERAGFAVSVSEDLSVYEDADLLARTDLVVHSWSGGELSAEQEATLVAAVEAGTGFAGWHGGVIGTNVRNARYLRMVGGRFVWHPEGFQEFTVHVADAPPRDGEITEGIGDFDVETEHYWVLSDALNTVLATSVLAPGEQWAEPVEFPVVWTRRWGAGRVFVCTLGHRVSDLEVPQTATIVERGLVWAARRAPLR
ncbi:ThuA domain-containing protein [Prauserella cavernicola]|uniref:ThuA domain-containing protein n=1 Tax=Prauserella cavernicola TaxID=2800127 RepID=A0A934QNN7_9PSEU|nr:ThuA domain-containing protein [Prauserella cavernicola]MBK1783845.1 ThuA domain-containing protein [Prauserella cavernicola]